jgi:hypothetical protein
VTGLPEIREGRRVIRPIADMRAIVALATKAEREAALLRLEPMYRYQVGHYLVMHYAKALCEALPTQSHEAVLAEIPDSLLEDARALGRSYVKAAQRKAASDPEKQQASRYKDGDDA